MVKELIKNDYSSVSVDFLSHPAGPKIALPKVQVLLGSTMNFAKKFVRSETSNFSLANLIDYCIADNSAYNYVD
jgi:hypothetical protein